MYKTYFLTQTILLLIPFKLRRHVEPGEDHHGPGQHGPGQAGAELVQEAEGDGVAVGRVDHHRVRVVHDRHRLPHSRGVNYISRYRGT